MSDWSSNSFSKKYDQQIYDVEWRSYHNLKDNGAQAKSCSQLY